MLPKTLRFRLFEIRALKTMRYVQTHSLPAAAVTAIASRTAQTSPQS